MRVLITGGNGFLGKHIRAEFPNAVQVLAPSSTELDVLNYDMLVDYAAIHKPDCILHMAAKCGGINANKNSPADFLRDNTQMALNIYEAARISGIKLLYSLGSVCAYPKYCPTPFREETIWDGAAEETNFPYGQAKRTLMMLGQTYREQYGFKGAHLIPVNMYGEHDHFDLVNSHVIPALIRKFVTAVDDGIGVVECWGSGDATRDFLYAGDAAEAIAKAVLTGIDYEGPINLGTGKDISVRSLADLIARLTGFTGKIVFNGSVSDGQPRRMLDVQKAKTFLDWKANTDLEMGLKKTIVWYKKYRPTK